MDRPERIAVLGAGGFLGSHLVPALVVADHVARYGAPVEAHWCTAVETASMPRPTSRRGRERDDEEYPKVW